MRMPQNHFFADFIRDIIDVKASIFFGNARMEEHLEHHIPQLFFHKRFVVFIQALDKFIGFLDHSVTHAFMGLFPVPCAAVLTAQNFDKLTDIRKRIVFFFFKCFDLFRHFLFLFLVNSFQ